MSAWFDVFARVRPGGVRARSWQWLAIFGLAAAMLLAACSGGDSTVTPTSPAASPTAAPTEAPTQAPTEAPIDTTIEAIDSGGTAFTLDGPAQRIVSHSPGATEILFAIGAGAQVMAVDEFSYYPEEAQALPKVAYTQPDPEQVLSFDPDLVIFASWQEQALPQFRSLDIPVFLLAEAEDLAGVFSDIRLLGRLTGHEDAADALADALEQQLAELLDTLSGVATGPRVFWELDSTLYTVAPETFIGNVLSELKLQNIAAGAISPYPQLTNEAVVEGDPEVILLADHQWGVTPESLLERPGWSGISAVVNDRVYPVDEDIMSRPGPRIIEGMESIARVVYSELFE